MKKLIGVGSISVLFLAAALLHSVKKNRDRPLVNTRLGFVDQAIELGIRHTYFFPDFGTDNSNTNKRNRRQFIFSPGVAVADFNGDTYMDFFIVNGDWIHPSSLYLNDHNGGFKESAKLWNVDKINLPKSSASGASVLDFNRDGRPDLFIAGLGCSRLFKNMGTFFEEQKDSGATDCKNSIFAIPLDLNADGFEDLFVIRYFGNWDLFNPNTPNVWRDSLTDSSNGGQDSLLLNLKNGKFQDITASSDINEHRWGLDGGVGDFDNDGAADLYIANDFGPDALYSIENGRLVNQNSRFTMPDRRYGMGFQLVDLAGNGFPHVYVSNAYIPRFDQRGNFLWRFFEGDKKISVAVVDDAEKYNLNNCLWAWGSVFADFDLNGRVDAYITNGLSSPPLPADRKKVTLSDTDVSQDYKPSLFASIPGVLTSNINTSDFVAVAAANQVDCVFENTGKRFEDVSTPAGIYNAWDGRSVAAIDVNNNGLLDLIVSTANGPVHFLKNHVVPANTWVGFDLVGKASTPKAIGARVKVTQNQKDQYRWSTGGKGGFLSFSDPRLHFGLESDANLDVEVRWPSGQTTSLKGIEVGKYYRVSEGEEK